MVDVHFLVYPVVRQFLKFDINEINVENLEKSVKLPLDREIFYSAASLLALEPQEDKHMDNMLSKTIGDEGDE